MRFRELEEDSKYVTVNTRLNPKIWPDGELDPKVREKLIEIARAFEEFLGVDLPVKDYTITGSNANYTWTRHSDLDLHIIIPGTADDAARELYSSKKTLWGDQHNITIRGLPVECYVQGEDEPHHSTGVYSLVKNTWLVKPKKVKPNIDDASVSAKCDSLVRVTREALQQDDLDRLRAVKDKITTMRKAGLERAGEWSVENLCFKTLRNLGLIDDLTERIRSLEDEQLSLEQTLPLD
jgi:hypothetical protein